MKRFKQYLLILAAWSLCGLPAYAQVTQIFGDAIDRPVQAPQGLTVCNGILYVADSIPTTGKVRGVNLAINQYIPTVAKDINLPVGLACDPAGQLFVTEAAEAASRVWLVNADGTRSLVAQMASGAAPRGLTIFGSGLAWANWGNNSSPGYSNSVWMLNQNAPFRIAGTGTWNSTGDGGPALNATFRSPYGIAVLPDGSLAVSEHTGNRIRKFTAGGNIETIAGDGSSGFTGDNGTATIARVNAPTHLAAYGGDLYIADTGNQRVRRIRNGVISTVWDLSSLGAPTGLTVYAGIMYASVSAKSSVYAKALPDAPATFTPAIAPATFTPTVAPPTPTITAKPTLSNTTKPTPSVTPAAPSPTPQTPTPNASCLRARSIRDAMDSWIGEFCE